ncbi:hypothetical protein SLEP1_g5133 [Rubroshorea leprosula]|uniref:Uncharacterized protein n=1 Tax=Rubroshorea leprosula TaxID=152421 RepID=A0AAV5HRB0_9ROSI|nr:hypothetical protein SLEP1_g5133 [Rubroshorea leprosula]
MEQQGDEEEGDADQEMAEQRKKNMEVIAKDPFKPPCKGLIARPWSL